MNSFIEYFYGISVKDIKNEGKYYSFINNNYVYKLYIYDYGLDIKFLLNINKQLIGKVLIGEIVLNKNNSAISTYNGIPYVLIRLYVNDKSHITLSDINYLNNLLITTKLNINWAILWSKKIDYLEEMISEFGKKYPIMVDSFNYFVGMAENAISYFNNVNIMNNYTFCISHKVITPNSVTEDLYNPLNIIFDYRVRDVSEYIKNSFWENNQNIFCDIKWYIDHNNLNITDIKLLVSRLIYPSFYFNLYECILVDNVNEKIIIPIISRVSEYEEYLASIIAFLKKYYDIDEIDWLKK